MTIACPDCAATIDVPEDYVPGFGGTAVRCTCGRTLDLDGAEDGRVHPDPSVTSVSLDEPGRDPAVDGTGIWQDLGFAIVVRGAALPHRCFRCNAAAERATRFLLKWSEPEERGKAFARAVLEKAREEQILVTAYVCPQHARLRNFGRWLGPGVMLCGLGLVGVAVALEVAQVRVDLEDKAFLTGIGLLIFGFLLRYVRIGQLAAGRISRDQAVVEGCGPAFIASLPPWEKAADRRTERLASNLHQLGR